MESSADERGSLGVVCAFVLSSLGRIDIRRSLGGWAVSAAFWIPAFAGMTGVGGGNDGGDREAATRRGRGDIRRAPHSPEEGREFLRRRSPLTRVDAIARPLLIAQGANDPRVKRAESDSIANAMSARGIPVTYILYPDEGHGFARPENNLSFMAAAEAFLSRCIGSRAEPVGDDFDGSSIEFLSGDLFGG